MKRIRKVLNIIYFCVMLLVLLAILLVASISNSKALWKVFVNEYEQLSYYVFYYGLISEEGYNEVLERRDDVVAVLKSKGIL